MNLPTTAGRESRTGRAGSACTTNVCSGGSCIGTCKRNAVRCSGTQPQVCSATGTWTNNGSNCQYVSQTAGGEGGYYADYPTALATENGSLGLGGQGGQCRGGDDAVTIDNWGGSGGGGYYGGGGGCENGGGGGSSYIKTSLLVSGKTTLNASGSRSGDGFVTITW